MTAASRRLLSPDLKANSLRTDGSSPSMTTASDVLWEEGFLEIGLWEAGPGSEVDVEVDEVFLVLSGSGTVIFQDDSRIELTPGTLVRLHVGDRTTWVITDCLRKLYIAPIEGEQT